MRSPPAVAAGLALSALAGAARADTLKVPSEEFATIQSAVTAAGEGDTVVVTGGTWTETVTVSGRINLRILGKGGPVIEPGPSAMGFVVVAGSQFIEISGFTIDGALRGVAVGNSMDVKIRKVVVDSSASDGISMSACNRVLISKCVVNAAGGHGISDDSSVDVTVEKCVLGTTGSGSAIYLSTQNLPGEGSDRAKISRNKIVAGYNGISLGGQEIVVEKNSVEGVQNYGIYFDASTSPVGAVVAKNSVTVPDGSYGIYFYGINFQVTRNRLRGGGIFEYGNGSVLDRNAVAGGFYGIYCAGSGATVSRNSIKDVQGDGIFTGNYVQSIDGNKIRAPGGHGIQMNSSGGPITKNVVWDAGNSGFFVPSGGNTLTGNMSVNADRFGFYVSGSANTLSKNKAKGSGLFDLADPNAPGANTYNPDNRFGTTQIPYVP